MMQVLEKLPEKIPPCPICGKEVERAVMTYRIEAFGIESGYDFDVPQHGEPRALLFPCKDEVNAAVSGYEHEEYEGLWMMFFKEALLTIKERWDEWDEDANLRP